MRKLIAVALLALTPACSVCAPSPALVGADHASSSGPDLPATNSSSGDQDGSSGSSGTGEPLSLPAPVAAPAAAPAAPPSIEVVVEGGPMRTAK